MSHLQRIHRSRTNPVEIAIFSIVTLVLFHSLYTLFYDDKPFYHASLAQAIAAQQTDQVQREPASSQAPALLEVKIDCETPVKIESTSANGVKISGPLCGTDLEESGNKLAETNIVNATNHFSATVFTDTELGKFSTDYIPLTVGNNVLKMNFKYASGEHFDNEFVVTKN